MAADFDSLQAAMILNADASGFKKIGQGCESFTAVAGARGHDLNQVPERVVLAIDFAIAVFHFEQLLWLLS